MNLFALAGLSVAVATLIICFITLIYGRTKLHRVLFLFNFLVCGWGIGCFVIGQVASPEASLFGWRLAHLFGLFIGPTFYFLVYTFCSDIPHRKPVLIFMYLQGLFFELLNLFSPGFINTTWYAWGFHYNVVTPQLFFGMGGYLFCVLFSFYELLISLKRYTGRKRMQAKYIMFSFAFGFVGGTSTFLPEFKVDLFYPLGNFGICIYTIILSYALMKHHLMDINIVIRKSIVYSLVIACTTGLYLISIMIFERVFKNVMGYQDSTYSILSVLLIAMVFAPLRNRIQDFVDRTFFRKSAMQMAQENEMLRQELAQSERYKMLAALTSGIVDEIKNPLTTLKGYGHFLFKRAAEVDFVLKFAEINERELNKINELLQHLTDYSNPAPLATENTDMSRMLNETVGLLKSQMIENKIELNVDFQISQSLQLRIDPSQMRQALSNIIINAIEAMPAGGKMSIAAEEDEEAFYIKIKDSGPGIDTNDLAKIFDPFFSRKEGHSGLGLSITQGIIHNHNGKIRILSESGQGAEFIVQLPLILQPAEIK